MENTIIKKNTDTEEIIEETVNSIVNNIIDNDKKSAKIDIASFYDFTYKITYIELDDEINNLDTSKNNQELLEKYDMKYREDLLLIFKLGIALAVTKDINSVLDSCTKCIEYLYEYYKENSQIKIILSKMEDVIVVPFKLEDKTLFMYLFSIDYFYYFNECLKELYKNNEISKKTFKNLIDKINKK